MPKFNAKFQPAVNKVGLSKLTFKGVSTLEGKAGDTSKSGKTYANDWIIYNLSFEVMGLVKGSSKVVTPKISNEYVEGNDLAVLLKNMGYVIPDLNVFVEEDDDEFGQIDEENYDLKIDEFLDSCVDKIYFGKVIITSDPKTGIEFYDIDLNSIKPKNLTVS